MPVSEVRGIISNDDERLLRYFALVQEEAAKRGKVFFIAEGDCHDWELDDLYLTAMCGWLIPNDLADEFEAIWRLGSNTWRDNIWHSEWTEKYYVVEDFDDSDLLKDGSFRILFTRYPDDGEPYEV